IERETFAVTNGTASGTLTKFRSSLNKTLRFELVTNATIGNDGYVNPATVSFNGGLVATRVADANGNVAFQVTVQ
ncbi:MAG: hypothetical protein AAB791_01300, partial [Patescibacteria group bacterium]